MIRSTDALALMRARLMRDDDLTAVVADRIRTEHAYDPTDLEGLRYPMVIMHLQTGQGRYHGGLQHLRVELYGYSDTSQGDAVRVYDLAYTALQAGRLWDPSGAMRAAGYTREVERPLTGWNEQTRSWYAKGTWAVTLAG